MKTAGWVAALALVLVAGFSAVLHARNERDRAMARADSVHAEWVEAALESERLLDSLEVSKARTAVLLDDLAHIRARADSLAAVADAQIALETQTAHQTGETLAETLDTLKTAISGPLETVVDTARAQLERHLVADARTVEAFENRLDAEIRKREAADEAARLWQSQAEEMEGALVAKTVECRLCREEVEILRAIRDPSWLEDLWAHGKSFGAGALSAVVVLALVL